MNPVIIEARRMRKDALRGTPPLCGCGCGAPVKWGQINCWNTFVGGHQNRGINNPMHGRLGKACPSYKASGKRHPVGSPPMCGCGCDLPVLWDITVGAWGRFKHGHNRDISGINNPMYGKRPEEHWAWRGGITEDGYISYEFTRKYKREIKQRDNHICQNPHCWETSLVLSVHHIDYDKTNNHESNLITICNVCNSRANKGRDAWKCLYAFIVRSQEVSNG